MTVYEALKSDDMELVVRASNAILEGIKKEKSHEGDFHNHWYDFQLNEFERQVAQVNVELGDVVRPTSPIEEWVGVVVEKNTALSKVTVLTSMGSTKTYCLNGIEENLRNVQENMNVEMVRDKMNEVFDSLYEIYCEEYK